MKRWLIYLGVLIAVIAILAFIVGCRQSAPSGSAENAGKQDQANADKAGKGQDEGAKSDEEEGKKPATTADAKNLLQQKNPHADTEAIKKLSELLAGPPGEVHDTAAQILADLALKSDDTMTRATAVGALATDAAKSMPVLLKAAKDKEPEVRTAAATAIGFAPDSQTEAVLSGIAKSDPDPKVQQAANIALTNLRATRESGQFGPLVMQLGQTTGDAAAQAAIALTVKGADALDPLIACLRSSGSDRQREGAAMCIAMICAGVNPTQQSFARLAKATTREQIQPHAANLKGLDPLIGALKDPDPCVRDIAAQGLGYIGDERAALPLAGALSDPDETVRRRAAAALVTTPAKPALPALARACTDDSSPAVRRFAAEALGWIKDPAAVEPLVRAASDKSPEVRRYAAMQLGRLGDKRAVTALTSLFGDSDDDVRWAAVLSVGNLRDPQAEDALVRALSDSAPQVANAAERALQRLGVAKRKLEPGERGYSESRG